MEGRRHAILAPLFEKKHRANGVPMDATIADGKSRAAEF